MKKFLKNIINSFLYQEKLILNSEKSEEEENEQSIHDSILGLLIKQESFPFDKKNLEKISEIKWFIDEFYIKLFDYVISWDFINGEIDEIILELEKLRDKFNNDNIGQKKKTMNFLIFLNE